MAGLKNIVDFESDIKKIEKYDFDANEMRFRKMDSDLRFFFLVFAP